LVYSNQLLARVDAALETAGCDVELTSTQTSTTHLLEKTDRQKPPSPKQAESIIGKRLEQFQPRDVKPQPLSLEVLYLSETKLLDYVVYLTLSLLRLLLVVVCSLLFQPFI